MLTRSTFEEVGTTTKGNAMDGAAFDRSIVPQHFLGFGFANAFLLRVISMVYITNQGEIKGFSRRAIISKLEQGITMYSEIGEHKEEREIANANERGICGYFGYM